MYFFPAAETSLSHRSNQKNCGLISVSLMNQALLSQGSRQGIYEISPSINDKPTWTSASDAIWYLPQYQDWAIGPKASIGKDWAGIFSQGNHGGSDPNSVPSNWWTYWNGNAWTYQQNDIIIQCYCPTLSVTMVNGASGSSGASQRQDIYEFSGTVNGKPSWESATNGIWYIPQFNEWAIGLKSYVGTYWRWLAAYENQGRFHPNNIANDKWMYWTGSSWQSQQNEIFVECLPKTIKVNLMNNALASQESRQGIYEVSGIINGKPSWSSASQAIWYLPQFNVWAIGSKSWIGQNWVALHTIGDQGGVVPSNVPSDKWKYWSGSSWKLELNSIFVKGKKNYN